MFPPGCYLILLVAPVCYLSVVGHAQMRAVDHSGYITHRGTIRFHGEQVRVIKVIKLSLIKFIGSSEMQL